MGGNKIGGAKARDTNQQRHGADYYARIGSLGGLAPGAPKGFAAMPRDKVSAAGRKGGTTSRKGTAVYIPPPPPAATPKLFNFLRRRK